MTSLLESALRWRTTILAATPPRCQEKRSLAILPFYASTQVSVAGFQQIPFPESVEPQGSEVNVSGSLFHHQLSHGFPDSRRQLEPVATESHGAIKTIYARNCVSTGCQSGVVVNNPDQPPR